MGLVLALVLAFMIPAGCQRGPADEAASPDGEAEVDQAGAVDAGGSVDAIRRYGLESGIIEYEISGQQIGRKTVYFDRWGMREAEHLEFRFAGEAESRRAMTLIDGEWIYEIDLESGRGTRVRNPILLDLAESTGSQDLTEVGPLTMEEMGGERVGTREIAGRTCDMWEAPSLESRMCFWRGIHLLIASGTGEWEIAHTAVRVEENPEIPTDHLEVPPDVRITDLSALEPQEEEIDTDP